MRTAAGGAVAPSTAVIALDARHVAIEGRCPTTRLRTRRTRLGWQLAARWRECDGGSRLRLRAHLSTDCTLLDGTVTPAGAGPASFAATPTACGDGAVDERAGETCDDGNVRGGDTCEADCTPCDPAPGPYASTWSGLQANVIVRYGCPECHGALGIAGLDLRPDAAFVQLVGAPAIAGPGLVRVTPGFAEASIFWLKLAKGTRPRDYDFVAGGGMPVEERISEDELAAIGHWIVAGAPATGVVPGTDVLRRRCRPR